MRCNMRERLHIVHIAFTEPDNWLVFANAPEHHLPARQHYAHISCFSLGFALETVRVENGAAGTTVLKVSPLPLQ